MDKKSAKLIVEELSKVYSDVPALKFNSPYELLVAVILSAQCTDERVNRVTAELFKEYNTPDKMVTLTEEELGKKIFSVGFYRAKSEHILSASNDILKRFGGRVPDNIDDLMTLSGVGRKTANVVYSVAFKGQAIAVDTHVFRVANRIGLTDADGVFNVEKGLQQILDKSDWSRTHHYLIYLGRNVCKSQKPDCINCPINTLCEKHMQRRGK